MRKQMVALLAGAMLTMATSAMALTLTLSSGGITHTFIDNQAGDLDSSLGSLFVMDTINGITVRNVNAASVFDATSGTFDIGSYVVSGKGLLTISLSDSGLTLDTPALVPNLVVTQNLSNSNNVNSRLGANYSVGDAVVSGDVKVNGVYVSGIGASIKGTDSVATIGYATVGNTFSLSEFVSIELGNLGNTVSLDSLVTVAPVPEPGTMMLLGMGMLGLAVYGKRRMNKEA